MAPGRESAAGGLHLFYLVGIECINSLNPPDSGGYDGGWGANHMNEYRQFETDSKYAIILRGTSATEWRKTAWAKWI